MGLANLVPGISGGTMLLAAGVYPRFITAIGEITTLKFRTVSIVALVAIVGAALAAIVLLAGPVKDLVVNHRWVMYSLFIGLTLGGVPVILKLIGKMSGGVVVAASVGFLGMAALAIFQAQGAGAGGGGGASWILLFLAGIAGAGAMILPGVSGGYLLLVLGVYVHILRGIDDFKEALSAANTGQIFAIGANVILPVGLGVVIGIVAVSNLLRWLLMKFERPTLGVLLGLLLGAVVGLWPFQEGVAPAVGSIFKGQTVTADLLATIAPEDYPTSFFTPTATQMAAALGFIALGFAITWLVARLGRSSD